MQGSPSARAVVDVECIAAKPPAVHKLPAAMRIGERGQAYIANAGAAAAQQDRAR